MKTFVAVLFCIAAFSFSNPPSLKEQIWSMVKISDPASARSIDYTKRAFSLYFSSSHLLLKTSDEVLARYTFPQPGRLSVKWGDFPALKGDVSEQQLKWYCKYRFSRLLYSIEGDTLKLRDVSGVTYTLVRR